jgi:hypothetical protein
MTAALIVAGLVLTQILAALVGARMGVFRGSVGRPRQRPAPKGGGNG